MGNENLTSVADALARMVPPWRQLVGPLLVNGVLPVLAYALLRPHVGSDTTALLAVLGFPLADVAASRVRGRPLEPIALIAIVGVGLTAVGTWVSHGDPLLLKIRPGAITAFFGAGCLLSLLLARPALFHVGRAFAATNADLDQLDSLILHPVVLDRLRRLTLTWAVGLLGQAAINIALALTVSTGEFLVGSLAVDWLGLAGLLAWTHLATSRTAARLRTAPITEPQPA